MLPPIAAAEAAFMRLSMDMEEDVPLRGENHAGIQESHAT